MVHNLTKEDVKELLCIEGLKDEELDYMTTQINFLTKGETTEVERFVVLYHLKAKGSFISAIQGYKELIRQEGRGCIDLQELKRAYQEKEVCIIQALLSELGLTYITEGQVNNLVARMEVKGWTIEDLHNRHKERPNRNIINIVG